MREEHREKNAERFGIEEDPCSTQTSQTLDTGEWNKVKKKNTTLFVVGDIETVCRCHGTKDTIML